VYFDGGKYRNRTCIYDKNADKYLVKQIPSASTNNELEYHALIRALKYAIRQYPDAESFEFIGDSKLIIKQVWGGWRINLDTLIELNEEVNRHLDRYSHKVQKGTWISRDSNIAGIHLDTLKKKGM